MARSTKAVGSGAGSLFTNPSDWPMPRSQLVQPLSTRPRTASTETKTSGAYDPGIGTSTTGSVPLRSVTKLDSTPSRSTVTSAVAARNGIRTWKRAVSPAL